MDYEDTTLDLNIFFYCFDYFIFCKKIESL